MYISSLICQSALAFTINYDILSTKCVSACKAKTTSTIQNRSKEAVSRSRTPPLDWRRPRTEFPLIEKIAAVRSRPSVSSCFLRLPPKPPPPHNEAGNLLRRRLYDLKLHFSTDGILRLRAWRLKKKKPGSLIKLFSKCGVERQRGDLCRRSGLCFSKLVVLTVLGFQ